MTQQAIADATGASQQTVSRILNTHVGNQTQQSAAKSGTPASGRKGWY
jgi:hypothetical protein